MVWDNINNDNNNDDVNDNDNMRQVKKLEQDLYFLH